MSKGKSSVIKARLCWKTRKTKDEESPGDKEDMKFCGQREGGERASA